ncbi:MAG: hypothetical protein AAF560_24520 [Acidobacteriota bacterium]
MPFPLETLAELLLATCAFLTSLTLAGLLSQQLDPEPAPQRRR